MRKFSICFALFLCLRISLAQIPNAGMELWDNQPVLLGWQTNSRPLTLPAWEPYIIRQDTAKYSGSFAANFWANGVFKAEATTTFPVSFHPNHLSLYYQLNFAPCVNDAGFPEQDTASVLIELLNNGTVVDAGYWESKTPAYTYTHLTIPISQNAGVFDSCRITISGGKVFGGCGFVAAPTEFRVDELTLKYSSVTSCIDSQQICTSCPCIAIYDPVCGCDGNTYGNSCEAYNAGVTNWTQGVCGLINDSCSNVGVVVQGVECLLVADLQTSSLLLPCTLPVGAVLHIGDTIAYDYVLNNCASICQQGVGADFTCFRILVENDTTIPHGECIANFGFTKRLDTVLFFDMSSGAAISGYLWDFGDGDTSTVAWPEHIFPGEGAYTVCLTITGTDSTGTPCTDTFCDTINITHACIDSSLICDFPLCCDFVPQVEVCGCDSITYPNACDAESFHGVTSYYIGRCVTTGIHDHSSARQHLFVYPNPAKESVNITYELTSAGAVTIYFRNLLGQQAKQYPLRYSHAGKHSLEVNISDLMPGVYLVELTTERNRASKLLVKE